jgi:hypothetical protein
MRTTLARLVVSALLAAAAGTGLLSPQPAAAAACAGASGVTVVVDFHQLGGGVEQVCDANGAGKSAAALFSDNGFALTYVQRQPGFVCRVSGAPASDPCVNTPPTDAYWGLFWSNGTSGTWSYASQGAGSLSVPDGGYVGFSWQGSSTKTPPGVAPAKHATSAPSSSPTRSVKPTPTSGSSSSPSPEGESDAAEASGGAATRSAGASGSGPGKASRPASAEPSSSSSTSPTPAAGAEPPSTPPAGDAGGSLPVWVVAMALLVLAGAAGVTTYLRRSRGPATP